MVTEHGIYSFKKIIIHKKKRNYKNIKVLYNDIYNIYKAIIFYNSAVILQRYKLKMKMEKVSNA